MHQYAEKVRDGIIKDPEFQVVMYGADLDDDWTSPETWKKANPNYGVSVQPSYLESQVAQAKENSRHENDFRRYHLNQWTTQSVRWLPMDKWALCTEQPGTETWTELRERMQGRKCTGGLDLASTTDINALVWLFEPDSETPVWTVVPRFWVPEDKMLARVRRDRQPYDRWVAEGAMEATAGNVTDYRRLHDAIMDDAEYFDVTGLAYDRWNSSQLVIELMEDGMPMVQFGQGTASMSAPSKQLERLTLGEEMNHGGHPVLTWMASNVAIREDAQGNIKPAKDKSTEKIDGIVALIMALGLAIDEEPDPGSYLEESPLVFLS